MLLNLSDTTNWEEHFLQEALELEMKMKEMETESLSKSKLRLALEHNILSWDDFSNWYMRSKGCCSLKTTIGDEALEPFINKAKIAMSAYSELGIWSEDLVPLMQWNGNTYVAGLQYSEKLMDVEDVVFILAPPQILSYLYFKISGASFDFEKQSESETGPDGEDMSSSMFGAKPSFMDSLKQEEIDLSEIKPVAAASTSEAPPAVAGPVIETAQPAVARSMFGDENVIQMTGQRQLDKNSSVWDFLSERHHEYNFEAKKSFDAFVVLKINKGKTQVFKLDPDLSRDGVSNLIFEYDINKTPPFRTVQGTGRPETYALKELNMKLSYFTHVCITPLRRGRDVIGFFLGLNRGEVTDNHKQFLSELADEVAVS